MPTESSISKRKLTAAQLEEKATALRLAGLSCGKIGKQLGVHESTAWRAIERAKKRAQKLATETVEEMRRLEADRLMFALQQLVKGVSDGDTNAIREWRALCESHRKLWGLDAPTKTSMANIDLANLTTAQLERLAKGEDIYVILADAGAGGA